MPEPDMETDNRFAMAVHALVRPLVTLTFSGAMTYGWINDRLSDDAFLGVAGMVIGFWFTQRQASRRNGDNPSTAKVPPAVPVEPPPGV